MSFFNVSDSVCMGVNGIYIRWWTVLFRFISDPLVLLLLGNIFWVQSCPWIPGKVSCSQPVVFLTLLIENRWPQTFPISSSRIRGQLSLLKDFWKQNPDSIIDNDSLSLAWGHFRRVEIATSRYLQILSCNMYQVDVIRILWLE